MKLVKYLLKEIFNSKNFKEDEEKILKIFQWHIH